MEPSGVQPADPPIERFKLPHRAHPFWVRLAQACPLGPCTPEIAFCWAEIKLPSMQERNYRRVQVALAKWWGRLEEWELRQARARLEEITSPSVPVVVPPCPSDLRGQLPFREIE